MDKEDAHDFEEGFRLPPWASRLGSKVVKHSLDTLPMFIRKHSNYFVGGRLTANHERQLFLDFRAK